MANRFIDSTPYLIKIGLLLDPILASFKPEEQIRGLSELANYNDVPPFTLAEAFLVMSIAKRNSNLAYPATIDLENPQHFEAAEGLVCVVMNWGERVRVHQKAKANS